MKLIWKLLRENISKPQLIGFFIANLTGMVILLIAFQFYFDIIPIFTKKDTLFKRDYFTITKKVNMLNSLTSKSSGFTRYEVEELENTGFIRDIGNFTSSQFGVHAGINQQGMGFGTEMFFESVPDRFIDIKPENWQFAPGDNTLPIILPKSYLDLYNFGFAESRSMPKISENMVGMVALNITIWGNGERKQMKGRIAGFSNRINTILVPEAFMEWANQQFSSKTGVSPSRLIIEVNNIADPEIAQFLKNKGYEVEGDNAAVSRMAFLLKILVGLVAGVGGLICLLSFGILALSIYLLLEKNMQKLQKLRLIGYKKSTIIRPYQILVILINLSVIILAFVLLAIIQSKYSNILSRVWTDFEPAGLLNTILIGFGIFIFLSIVNLLFIRSKVK